MIKSNILITSNIYPVRGRISEDIKFLNNVEGKAALDFLNFNTDYKLEKNFTKVQKKQRKYGMKCCGNENGDFTWGLINENGTYKIICRCTKIDCNQFNECRPDFDKNEFKYVIEKNAIIEDKNIVENENISFLNAPNTLDRCSDLEDLEKAKIPVLSIIDNKIDDINDVLESIACKNDDYKLENEDIKSITEDEMNVALGEDIKISNKIIQEFVVKSPYQSKLLINAGPGMGKTYTLIERVKYLSDNFDLNLSEEVLVLCFSRSAVLEIKKRLQEAIDSGEVSNNLGFIDIRTFDSFSTYLINQIDEDMDLSTLDYDKRIELASQIIIKKRSIFSNLKHFIVDEIQDLVGFRAQLIKEILKSLNYGFTLFGDSCQAIYDYQVKKSNDINSKDFYKWLSKNYSDDLNIIEFNYNYRQINVLNSIANKVRNVILSDATFDEKKRSIWDTKALLGNTIEVSYIYKKIENMTGKTCFLCRNNGEVLKLSQYLRNLGIVHDVKKSATNKMLESWIGKILSDYQYENLYYEDFKELMLKRTNFKDYYIDTKWNFMIDISQTKGSMIKLKDFVDNLLMDTSLSNTFYIKDESDITVSTIHRSKGREYDNVILLEDSVNKILDMDYSGDIDDELKTFYVAITRPKKELLMTKFIRKSYLKRTENSENRWVEISKSNKKDFKSFSSIEIGKENDVDIISFIDLNIFNNDECVLENQRYINEHVQKGDELILRRTEVSKGDFRYKIFHYNKHIGNMSKNFTNHIKYAFKQIQGFYHDLPIEIQNGYVDEVVTCSTKIIKQTVPKIYNKSLLWNGISIVGFGSIKWKAPDL